MNDKHLDALLRFLPECRIAVLGDFALDRRLLIDPVPADHAPETGLPVHQIIETRTELGAAANVVRNLAALRVGQVYPVGLIGQDADAFELARAFDSLGVRRDFLRQVPGRSTPVSIRAVLCPPGQPPREQSRFDIAPRSPLSADAEKELIADLRAAFAAADALIVADHAEAGKPGIVTAALREAVAALPRTRRDKPIVARSLLHIDRFRSVLIQLTAAEALTQLGRSPDQGITGTPLEWCPRNSGALLGEHGVPAPSLVEMMQIGQRTAERNLRPVLITLGTDGLLVCTPARARKIPAFPIPGAADPAGAGDTLLATFTASLAAGVSLDDAALLGAVAASLTVEQTGRIGTPSPDALRDRFREYARLFPEVALG